MVVVANGEAAQGTFRGKRRCGRGSVSLDHVRPQGGAAAGTAQRELQVRDIEGIPRGAGRLRLPPQRLWTKAHRA